MAVTSNFERGSATWQGASFSARGLVQAEQEAPTRALFNAATGAPNLGDLTLEIAKSVQNCNEIFAAALSENTINFETASAVIDSSSQSLIEGLAQTARECPGILLIEGHTDSQGAEEYNLNLSQDRASAVQVALSELGIAADRLNAIGYGESQPIADNESAEGRAQNRRITFTVTQVQ